MTAKPLCIDLFCGYGGWARGFLDAGYRVIGFDNEPKCAKRYPGEFVLADVRNLDGRRFRGARVIVASPPCQHFSLANNGRPRQSPDTGRFLPGPGVRLKRSPEAGMPLVMEAIRVITEARPEYWCLENVRGARRLISEVLGPPRAPHGAWQMWGRFPGFIAPEMTKGFHHVPGEPSKYLTRGPGGLLSAMIPYPLARALAEACLP